MSCWLSVVKTPRILKNGRRRLKDKFSSLFEILDPIESFKSIGRLYTEEQKKKIFKDIKTFNFIDV